jgi:hypothetical protein
MLESMTLSRAVVVLGIVAGAGRSAYAADCLDPGDIASQTETTDTAITLCFDAGGCWGFEIAAREWRRHATPRTTPAKPRPAELKTTANIHVCAPDGTDCHTFDLPGARTLGNLEALQTPDRTRVAILGQGSSAYLYDGTTKKLVATIRAWKSHYDTDTLQDGYFLDGNLALYESSTPDTMEARLFDGATGKPLAKIDDDIIGDPIELSDGDWAFPHADGNLLVVANARTGKLGKGISLPGPGVKGLGRGSLVTYRTSDKKVFLAARGDAASGIVVYDLATKKQTRYLPPVCTK